MKKRKKTNNENSFKKYFYSFTIKLFITIIVFIIAQIFIKQNVNNKKIIKNTVYKNNISFARIYNLYKRYFNFNVFSDTMTKEVKVASNTIKYNEAKKYSNGYIFNIDSNYFSAIKSGIIISKKKTSKFNYLITIQDKDGLEITYGFLNDINVKLYDYVKKDEIIGSIDKKVYLRFKKGNEYLSYENYL